MKLVQQQDKEATKSKNNIQNHKPEHSMCKLKISAATSYGQGKQNAYGKEAEKM